MVRVSKQQEKRNHRIRKSKGILGIATGPKKDNISGGFKKIENAIPSSEPLSKTKYIPRFS